MSINRHNYEEFFILYLDNELSSGDRRAVELFVDEHPDLKAELDLLLQSQLKPDTSVVFDGKEQLMRSAAGDAITMTNYEEWLLSYLDKELTADQNKQVENFIAQHPAIRQEFSLLQEARLEPDTTIVFANKEVLYRREEKVRVIGINWKRIAVAAAILFAVSTAAFIVFNNKNNSEQGLASETNKGNPEQKATEPAVTPPANEIASNPGDVIDKTNNPEEKRAVENNNLVDNGKKTVAPKQENRPVITPVTTNNDAPVLTANTDKQKETTNNLPQPTNNPYVNRVVEDNPIAMAEPAVTEPLTKIKETNTITSVTPDKSQPLDNVITAASIDPVDEEQPGKKNKLRGFFRKVTRTFEKTTNIKATDDEDRLLLGGLAIKL